MATSAEATYNLWFSTGILPQNGRNIQIEDVIIMYIIYIYIHYMVQILIGAAQQSFSEKKRINDLDRQHLWTSSPTVLSVSVKKEP